MAERPNKTADRLIEIADAQFTLHVAADGKPYALAGNGAGGRRPFTGKASFRQALAKAYLDAEGRLPQETAMRAALGVLAEKAAEAGLDKADQLVADLDPQLLQDPGPRQSIATQLVELALDNYDLGVTPDGETFAVPRVGPPIVRSLRGGRQSLRAELAAAQFAKHGAAAPQQALADCCSVLEGRAQQLEPTELHLRVAEVDGTLILDLGDASGRAVVISPRGWQVVDEPPVRFRRTALTGALPTPVRGGSLDQLWRLLNVRGEHRPVLAGVLVAELIPAIPHPVVSLAGEQGSGKSTAAKIIASVLDPATPQLRKAPRNADSWIVAAAGSWVVALDNLSGISDEISDALCRASTGDGDVRRRLYSDGDLHVISFRRCVIVNGIDLGAVKDDLADRLVTIGLDRIPDSSRKLDAALAADWVSAHPQVLGALLDLAVRVLQVLPQVRLDELPRMADLGRVFAAVDQVLGTAALQTYLALRTDLAEEALNSDPVLGALTNTITEDWEGTAADLLPAITPSDEKWRAPKGWPAKPRELTSVLKRRAPSLRRLGWSVEQGGKHPTSRAVMWKLAPPQRKPPSDARNARNAREREVRAGHNGTAPASDSRAFASEPSDERSTLDDRSHDARSNGHRLTSENTSLASVPSVPSDNNHQSPGGGRHNARKYPMCACGRQEIYRAGATVCGQCDPTSTPTSTPTAAPSAEFDLHPARTRGRS